MKMNQRSHSGTIAKQQNKMTVRKFWRQVLTVALRQQPGWPTIVICEDCVDSTDTLHPVRSLRDDRGSLAVG
jgi:hypothetical protein